jgi:AraC family transcriptional regulator
MSPHRIIRPDEYDKFIPVEVLAEGRTNRVFFRNYKSESGYFVLPGISNLMLVIYRDNLGWVRRRAGDGLQEGPARAGDVSITGVGHASEWDFPETKNPSHVNVTHIYFSNELMADVAASAFEQDYGKLETIDVLKTADRELMLLGDLLAQEMCAAADGGSLAVDYLASVMSVHLIRRHHCYSGVPEIIGADGKLTAVQKARVLDFIKTNLSQNFRMSELAKVVGLNEVQFLHCFRNTFGETTHQYVLNQRVQLAVERICRTKLTLAEIASVTGYSDQAHMTRAVKTATGQTPGALRRI